MNTNATQTVLLELHKDKFYFAAGHFTIFSATERETLHGHNYTLDVLLNMEVTSNGLACDYRHIQKMIHTLCNQLHRHFLLPTQSPYLTIEDAGTMWLAHHHEDKIPFLKKDVILLPLKNITIEELSVWFTQQLTADLEELKRLKIVGLCVRVYNGPGQAASTRWGDIT